jgi:hypothetical protein
MEKELLSAEKKEIILEDGRHFSYTITPAEIANSLGAAVAVLDEYFITDSNGETYKLYKTNEGNWYEIEDVYTIANNSILRTLKLAIDNKGKVDI